MQENITPKPFLQKKGNYRNLVVYQKTECIYDITYYFTEHYLKKGDRTIDQMVQSARSGKQNIAEGSAASTTSSETEIKLMNVAKASLQELLLDYEDYLRTRGLEIWAKDSAKAQQAREACKQHNDTAYYQQAIVERSDETIANIAIVLIHQADYMLEKLIDKLQIQFVADGGIREQMTQARLNYRNRKKSGK